MPAWEMYRQGEVLLVRVESLPRGLRRRRGVGGRLPVSDGSERRHTVAERDAEVLDDQGRRVYLLVLSRPTLLTHPDHPAMRIPPGRYEVVTVRPTAA